MRIEINRNVGPTRATISLIHELLHMGEAFLKDEREHVALHRAAVYLYSHHKPVFQTGSVSEREAKNIITRAFRSGGQPLEETAQAWADFFRREIVPTVNKYMERKSHGS